MELKFFCPYWGSNSLSYREFLKKVSEAGYDGVEMNLPSDNRGKSDILSLLQENNLELIGQHSGQTESTFQEIKKNYLESLYNLADAKPLFINSQTGKDYFSVEDNSELIDLGFKVEKKTGISVLHETHRGKFSFAAHVTKTYLEKIPGLKLGLDISHWCNVAESLLHDQMQSVDLAILHTRHIHARVGFPEGPQVTDPRLPEWEEALNFHLSCWDKVAENFKKQNREYLTITPEFGPYPYMANLPFTKMPVANQWEINTYMMELLRKRYNH
jgi:sugar phosphate isomerase/epimerase